MKSFKWQQQKIGKFFHPPTRPDHTNFCLLSINVIISDIGAVYIHSRCLPHRPSRKKCFPEANFSFKSYQYVSHAESLNTKIEKKMLSKYLFFPFNPPSLLLPFDMDRKIWNNKKVMYEKNFSRIEENRYVAARIFNSWMRYESIPFKDFVLSRAGIHTNIHTKRAEHKRNEILKRSQRTRQMKLDEDSLFIRLKWRANRSF